MSWASMAFGDGDRAPSPPEQHAVESLAGQPVPRLARWQSPSGGSSLLRRWSLRHSLVVEGGRLLNPQGYSFEILCEGGSCLDDKSGQP